MNRLIFLNLRYRTDPARIKRILPPPLEPDEDAIVLVDYALIDLDEPYRNVFVPEPYYESGFHVSATYRGHRGMFQVGMPMNQDWGRTMGRETIGYHKKDGEVSIEVDGNNIQASLWRHGVLLHRTETFVTSKPAHPLNWYREDGYGTFLYRFRLNPDWMRGPLGDGPVELWRLGGNDTGYPTEMDEGVGLPLACEITRTHFELVDPSPLDPFCEFPMLELIAVTYHATYWEGGVQPPQQPRRVSNVETGIAGPGSVFLEEVDKAAFEPWALLGYDRPVYNGKAIYPPGWPESKTAVKLTPEELDRYRSRKAINLDPITLADIELEIDTDTHAKILPPCCSPGEKYVIRILAIRVEISDISPVPFNELWLLTHCEVDNKPAYYAMSHIVSPGGDVIFGRETFGYPSKLGTIELRFDEGEFAIVGNRLGRDFFYCKGTLTEPRMSQHIDEFAVLGIQATPFNTGRISHAGLVWQPWSICCEVTREATTETTTVSFPDSPGPGIVGKPDPWFELYPCRVNRIQVSHGKLYRRPGTTVKEITNFIPYFMERFDGIYASDTQQALQMLLTGSRATFLGGENNPL
jgi:acetoacetate decarboxylase